MSRYRVDEPIPTSTTAHIYGPEGQVLGQIYRTNDTESERLKRFIEAHDEILDVLRDISQALHEQFAGPAVVQPSQVDKYAFWQRILREVDDLINRIDGEESE